MRTIRMFACLAFSAPFVVLDPAGAQDMQIFVEEVFQRAVLKVDVSSPNPVFDKEGKNICKSEGTAFLIGDQIAVTASHTYTLDPACGTPVIELESRRFNVQVFAEVLAVDEDVTVLRFSGSLPEPMCALALSNSDATSVDGVRFGIPGGMEYPSPMRVRIGSNPSDFDPFVALTSAPAERGESGGPVVYMFNVVGILRARHTRYTAYSVMTPIGRLRALLVANAIPLNARLCNPVEVRIFQTDSINFGARIRVPNTPSAVPPNMDYVIADARAEGIDVATVPSVDGSSSTIEIKSRSILPPPPTRHRERGGGGGGGGWIFDDLFAPLNDLEELERNDFEELERNDLEELQRMPQDDPTLVPPEAVSPRGDFVARYNRNRIDEISGRITKIAESTVWEQYIDEIAYRERIQQ
ncbi:hypothetical protein GOC28_08125 [Sinorhizobium meliloti]|nr:hypothetical protein [Sinorhizobium meliloti]MDX0093421.1 hypothetical protein [Sinorhizobium meliloti]